MMPDWPTLGTLDTRVQDMAAVLAFEALRMEIPVQSSNSRGFGLTFFGHNGLAAN